ncbi:response regulator transcription factor [Luteococcus sp. H138]|uniref:response regulator transcription factor n=1 Tax=unclassified Luteococcus TaxID=2639923 RepID=UPI00313D5DF0
MSIRIALADDDALVREGIVALLRHDPSLEVVVSCGDGGSLVRELTAHAVDVVLLDIRMPGLDGMATLHELERIHNRAPVAMLTTFRQEDLLEEAIATGAQGFLLKSDAPQDLIRQVHALADGGAVFSPRVAGWLISGGRLRELQERRKAAERARSLSPRQQDLLAQLATGASNAEIARTLHLSEGTIKQYLRALFDELGVANRVQAALVGYQAGCGQH